MTQHNRPDDPTTTPAPRRRSRRFWLLSAALAVVVVLAGLFIWAVFLDTPDAEAPILPTSTPVPQAQTYVVRGEESTLKATADGPLGALESSYDMGLGTIELNEEPGGWRVIANLTFDARTLDIGNEALNTMLRGILNVDRYPTGSFVAVGDALVADLTQPFTVDLVGQMELYGTVQDFTVPTTIALDGERLTLSAEMVIDPAVFGDSPGMGDGLDADLNIVAYQGERPTDLNATLTPAAPADDSADAPANAPADAATATPTD